MAMAQPHKLIKTIEQCEISPFPHPSLPHSLPLTFFDLLFLPFPPVQRTFFYSYSNTLSKFMDLDLPNLKHSLSISLHHYYPLAGTLISSNPEIVFSDTDSINFTVATSLDNFQELSANHAREVSSLRCLVPELVKVGEKASVFAVQVTLFPDKGICIGTAVHHAVADGSTYTNFMKTWSGSAHPIIPLLDRSLVRDSAGLKNVYLKDLEQLGFDAWDRYGDDQDLVIQTFVFNVGFLSRLGSKTEVKCSPYALACGYIWSCLTKTKALRGDRKKAESFGFVTGCRPRHEPPLPAGYFGNCLGICCVEARREDLIKAGGETAGAEAIWKVIKGLEKGAFGTSENWMRNVCDYSNKNALTVAGSPKLGLYEVDFGWGRPNKVEIVSIERTGALSLAESRDEKGGIEVGLVLPKYEMDVFVSVLGDSVD